MVFKSLECFLTQILEPLLSVPLILTVSRPFFPSGGPDATQKWCVWSVLKLVCDFFFFFFGIFSYIFLSCGLLIPSLSPSLRLISGSAMNVAYGEEEMKRFLEEATQVSQVRSAIALCVSVHVSERPPLFSPLLFCLVCVTCFPSWALPPSLEQAGLFFLRHLGGGGEGGGVNPDPWPLPWPLPQVKAPKQGLSKSAGSYTICQP